VSTFEDADAVRAALEGDDPAAVLAAAEIVVAASGQPAQDLDPATAAWLEEHAGAAAELIDLARDSVTRLDRGALRALWVEEDDAAWTLRLADLERRLGVR
jgi:Domain of unknown function (DUF4259)